MTAEVAIINPLGIALAADSAVTIQGVGQKVINSNLKLFSLSKYAPVAIMLYGNNNFLLETPWEVIFKLFRNELKDTKFETLNHYVEYFLEFISKQKNIFTFEKQEHWFKNQLNNSFSSISSTFQNQLYPNIGWNEKLIILNNNLDSVIQIHVNQAPSISPSVDILSLTQAIQHMVFETGNIFFAEFMNDSNIIHKLTEIARLLLTNSYNSLTNTGIVIAGYGEDEVYPSVITHEISGMFSDHLINKRIVNKTIINPNNSISPIAGIIPFAQEDIVMSFMKGIQVTVLNQVQNLMFNTHHSLTTNPNIQFSANFEPNQLVNSLYNQLNDNLINFIQHQMMNPMVNFVRFLPKDELALMAETLINITAFKQKMGSHLETVGGAIDVAIITKGDGLIWVKRKKYFDSSMNQHFFANYFRD